MRGEASVEAIRWKAARHPGLLGDALTKDPDGSLRAVAEGGWLDVVYAQDGSFEAHVETLERARVARSLVAVGGGRSGPSYYVAQLRVESSVGVLQWRSDMLDHHRPYRGGLHVATSVGSSLPKQGELTLPDGDRLRTASGTGLLDVPGYVRAYKAWRDADLAAGWAVVTEVSLSAPAEWRPLLAALPLLLLRRPASRVGATPRGMTSQERAGARVRPRRAGDPASPPRTAPRPPTRPRSRTPVRERSASRSRPFPPTPP